MVANSLTAGAALLLMATASGCAADTAAETEPPPPAGMLVVTFNTGTTTGLGHDAPPDDGYGSTEATLSDAYYGNGLAFDAVIADAQAFFTSIDADVIVFQEIFHPGDCAMIPPQATSGFVCDGWQAGDPTVAEMLLGERYQVACHLGHSDKCAAVHERVGRFVGCDQPLCLEGLAGGEVMDCGGGSRIGRGEIALVDGSSLTLVNVHGSSGIEQQDQDCRVKQFEQVFVDLGDGAPAANGALNLIMGDLNTDPGRMFDFDESAAKWNEYVGGDHALQFVSDVGSDATPSYAGLFNIDHVVSDGLVGSCTIAGITEGHPAVSNIVFFDHKPLVCRVDTP